VTRLLAVALLAALAAAAVAAAARKPPTRLQATAKEFYFVLSAHTVKAGPAIVELVNYGEDPHDLRLQRLGGGKVYRTKLLDPGKFQDLELTLLPGKYRLWCGVPTHASLGMKTTLVVKRSA
jgi:plastocyanin